MGLLPTPDPDNKQEMWLAFTLIGSFARSGNEWVFLGAVLLLILYLIGRFVYSTSRYLFAVYSERLKETGTHVRGFRWALGIAAVLGTIGLLVMFSGERGAFYNGLSILANTFCLLSLFTVIYDWWLSRKARTAQPQIGRITATDILRMKQTIKTARQPDERTKG